MSTEKQQIISTVEIAEHRKKKNKITYMFLFYTAMMIQVGMCLFLSLKQCHIPSFGRDT